MAHGSSIAPDGGWGWLVCFGSFTLQALTVGITYTFGIIFVELLDYFKTTESTTSWIGSIQPALLYFTGIVAGPLTIKLGCRKVAIFGSVLSAIGFATSALATNVYLLYLTYGVLTGIGNGCMYVTSMVCVQHYFSTRRALATGLAVSGSGVGLLIFGVLSPVLLSSVGWRWSLVVDAGITLVVGCACGAIYKPLPVTTGNEENDKTSLLVHQDTSTQKQAFHSSTSIHDSNASYGSVQFRNDFLKSKTISSIGEKPRLSENYSLELNIHEPEIVPNPEEDVHCCSLLKDVFDFSLFCNPVFTIFGFSVMMFGFGYHVPYTYIPERAMLLGISQTKASFLLSVMGIANIAIRLLLGWIADRSQTLRFYLAGVVLCLAGLLNTLLVFFTTYPLLIVYSTLFGALSGSFASLFPVILVDLLGLPILEKSMGQSLAVGSVAFLLASPMSGLIIDQTGSLVVPFYVVGAAEMVGGLAYFVIKVFLPRYGVQNPMTPELAEISTEQTQLSSHCSRRSSIRRISESFS